MTSADRVSTRGRSLPGWGVMPPNAGRRPSPHYIRERAAGVSNSDVKAGEYTTYAPKGEKCRKCEQPFTSLELVLRSPLRPGEMAGQPYVHIYCPKRETMA